jgi:hypothetical protein
MLFILEQTMLMAKEYDNNKKKRSFSNMKAQDNLILAMNRNVQAEWNPRLQVLKENKDLFSNDKELQKTYIEFSKLDNNMQKLTIWGINKTNAASHYISNAKLALKIAAGAGIATIVVSGIAISMVNKAGNGMFPSTGYRETYRDLETGEVFDHNPINDL